ncbi:MAG TPA: glycosyltransferase, partial [Candidatus Hydrogenedentes bacterium]|nr:glycosyltransferase [Candidatus Hydrogenedentota bacterium]
MAPETDLHAEEVSLDGVHNVSLVGTYVPRRCGIGTFTKDLHDALAMQEGLKRVTVLAIDDRPESYPYPEEVAFQIRDTQRRDYATAADLLNINQVNVAFIQHEYGIYGGTDGELVLELVRGLTMPAIATLHTVLREPSRGQEKVLRELAERSHRLVVMSRLATHILQDVYDVPTEKVAFIPHGIPDVPFVDPAYYKGTFGLEGHTVMLTFGLLSPGKGVETAIKALPKIVAKHPKVVFVILGATHPQVLKQEGNAYRDSLERLAEKLGVRENVLFHNRFVSIEELCGYIGASDIYVTPYLNEAQIVSGTLAYAVGAGKAVVSTPYWYAQEMLADGRGRLFPFGDADALGSEVLDLLANELERNSMRMKAYALGRSMVWPAVGQAYKALAGEVLAEMRSHPVPVSLPKRAAERAAIPEISLEHLRALTDDTGILQHATYAVPERDHGYCTDDNARALVAVLMYHDLHRDPAALRLANTYMAFLLHAFNPETGRFRNFMSYDRRWLEESGSEDSHGRALWALGTATGIRSTESLQTLAAWLFRESMHAAKSFTAPRAWAFTIVGIHAYLRKFEGDTDARRLRHTLSERLHGMFKKHGAKDWPWCEDAVSYANARLPLALILSGQWIPAPEMVECGLKALKWLLQQQVDDAGVVHLIGNDGWFTRDGKRANFDQQPIEAMSLVEACAEAYRCTQEPVWLERARQCFGWFLGNNEVQATLYDYKTGGCRDGLHPGGPSANEGAEST